MKVLLVQKLNFLFAILAHLDKMLCNAFDKSNNFVINLKPRMNYIILNTNKIYN